AEHRRRVGLGDLAQRHAQVGAAARHVDLARAGNRPGDGFGEFLRGAREIGELGIHRLGFRRLAWEIRTWVRSLRDGVRARSVGAGRTTGGTSCGEAPYTGANRIRFEGTLSADRCAGTPASGTAIQARSWDRPRVRRSSAWRPGTQEAGHAGAGGGLDFGGVALAAVHAAEHP